MNSNSCSDSSNDSMANPLQMNFGQPQLQSLQQERYVWEMRTRSPNVTPASTVLNSPDLNAELPYAPLQGQSPGQMSMGYGETGGQMASSYYYQRPHLHQIRVGRSPGSQFDAHESLPQGRASPGSPTDVGKADGQCLRDGEIVVFDDIDTNWMNKAAPVMRSDSQEDILKVTKMIGQLPIAEYEGSPRRFGNQPAAGSRKRPPGFPQRVSPTASGVGGGGGSGSGSSNHNVAGKASSGNLIDLIDHEEDGRTAAAREKTPAFDYLYEFSETRKVLEEFFKANPDDEKRFADYTTESGDDVPNSQQQQQQEHPATTPMEQAYIGQRLARIPKEELYMVHRSPSKKQPPSEHNNVSVPTVYQEQHNDIELYIDSNSRSSGDLADTELEANLRRHSRNFTLSPETTDYDSNCGDLDSLSNDINCPTDYGKLYTSMPVLEDGLSSGHASDTENNVSVVCDKQAQQPQPQQQQQPTVHEHNGNANGNGTAVNGERLENEYNNSASLATVTTDASQSALISDFASLPMPMPPPLPLPLPCTPPQIELPDTDTLEHEPMQAEQATAAAADCGDCCPMEQSHYGAVYAAAASAGNAVQQPATAAVEIQEAMKEIRTALQRAKTQPDKLKFCDEVLPTEPESPVWVPRKCGAAATATPATAVPEEEPDTDLETDRLLGQQRHEEQDFFSDQPRAPDSNANEGTEIASSNGHLNGGCIDNNNPKPQTYSTATIRQGIGTSLTPNSPDICQIVGTADITISGSPEKLQFTKSPTGSIKSLKDSANSDKKAKSRNKEGLLEPKVLIEGVLFRAKYLGSTQLVCEGQPTKSTRMMQAEEAVSRIKAPEGESQPSTEVDLFISTEKIMVLNTDLKEIMMDHALRTISYIADIGDLVVLMARRRFVPNSLGDPNPSPGPNPLGIDASNPTLAAAAIEAADSSPPKEPAQVLHNKHNRTPKMICHVFESDEAQFIAQSIGQAFQVAYMEFLKANGIENENLAKEMDYQEVLNSQEIFGDELEIFAKKELQKEVICSLLRGGIAERGGVRVGHRIIEINNQSVVAVPHDTIVKLLSSSVGEILMKTMPTSMFRLLTGQETPIYI
ncbi:GL13054 [Drosophila persimilis]|uniref:GL13054 n=1 Tax=Drosophila persimilis TaxID=7234 RepID=B4GUX4_DROPE|nr:GL13054 [Drosophila persimilis]